MNPFITIEAHDPLTFDHMVNSQIEQGYRVINAACSQILIDGVHYLNFYAFMILKKYTFS